MRVIDQYKEEKKKALEGQYPQLKKFVENNLIDIENNMTKYMRMQICILKEIKKNAIKYKNKKDIRGVFLPK